MSPKKKLPFDGYVRVSRVNGRAGESYRSPADQREAIDRLAAFHGLTVSEIVSEEDVSGGSKIEDRELGRLVQKVRDGESGGLLVWKVSRFSRNLLDGVVTADAIRKAGGRIIGTDLDTAAPMGKALLGFLLGWAEEEKDARAAGWVSAQTAAANRGIYMGAAPTGYRKGADRVLQKVDTECEKIAAAFRVRAGGGSWSETARALEGLPHGRKGKDGQWLPGYPVVTWTTASTRNLLMSRVYLGILPDGNGGVYHPALQVVTKETWEAANRREEPRPGTDVVKGGRRDSGQRSFAAGILRCAGCGRALTLSITTRNGREYAYFKCSSGPAFCSARAICRADEGEETVARLTRELFQITEREGNLIRGEDADPAVVGRLEHERDEARAYVAELTSAVEHGDKVPVAVLVGAQAALDVAEQALTEEKGKRIVQATIEELDEAWKAGTVEEKRALVRQMLGSVVVSRGKGPLSERVEVLP